MDLLKTRLTAFAANVYFIVYLQLKLFPLMLNVCSMDMKGDIHSSSVS